MSRFLSSPVYGGGALRSNAEGDYGTSRLIHSGSANDAAWIAGL